MEVEEEEQDDLEMIEVLNNRRFTISLQSGGERRQVAGNALGMYLSTLSGESRRRVREEGSEFFARLMEE